MKATLAALIFALTGVANATTIISQNLQCGHSQIQERVGKLVEQVIRQNADIVALQEVCSDESLDVVALIKQRLKERGFGLKFFDRHFTHLGYDHFDEELAIFSRLEVAEAEKGNLPDSPLRRGYLSIHAGGIWYVNTHLTHEAEASAVRFQQMDFLARRYSSQAAMVFGDFNSGPESREALAFLAHRFQAYFPGPTWPAQVPRHAYDGFWGNFFNSRPPKIQRLEDIGSDHLGIALSF
ncbi:MAG: hypothetical protein A2X86_01635 [Bdellovibrionales bacterium GWA2_49_15]|nr:MAG: hypothetical protein A2X86_01635 [Bdellovibrionales bacterium GWA2_49_15]